MPRTVACSAMLLLLLTGPTVHAQEVRHDSRHSLRSGAWALEFGVQPSFTSGFSGSAALSIKRHLSDDLGLRIGTEFTLSEEQTDVEASGPFTFPPEWETRFDRDSSDYTAFLHIQPFLSVRDRTAIYLYGGPFVRWVTLEEDYRRLVSNTVDLRFTIDYEAWYAGMELGAGFEWFWSRSLSLGAYYGVSAQYGEFRRDLNFYSGQQPADLQAGSGKRFEMDTSSSFFRLAAYF